MPMVFAGNGCRFYFFSNEEDLREPIHVHAESGDGEAKFSLDLEVTIAYSASYNRKQLARLRQVVIERRDEIDEDIPVEGLLVGRGDQTHHSTEVV